MKFVIDRSRWRCGSLGPTAHGEGETALLNPHGFMCCLGFMALQLGVPTHAVIGAGVPSSVEKPYREKLIGTLLNPEGENSGFDETELATDGLEINDDESFTDQERESLLVGLCRQHGHELEFVGEYA